MARKPENLEWVGYAPAQRELLDQIDFIGNNGWSPTAQTEALMPAWLGRLAESGVPIERTVEAMRSIGYHERALHRLEQWESKRVNGVFGR